MKRVTYLRDGVLCIFSPNYGARLAYFVTLANGERVALAEQQVQNERGVDVLAPIRVERILRRWPVDGAVAEWAEPEERFIERMAFQCVPVTLTDAPETVLAALTAKADAERTPRPTQAPSMLARSDAVASRLNFVETPYNVIDAAAVPRDRTFRNAWVHCPVNGCGVDMAKAREIHRDRLRRLRKPRLEALDIEFQRAQERGAPTGDIARRKQELRDATAWPSIDAASTPEELKAAIPECLA